MKSIQYLYPNGGCRAVTFSYDDGREYDRRLVGIFNKYKLKGTFHLNTGMLDKPGYIKSDGMISIAIWVSCADWKADTNSASFRMSSL